MVAHGLDDGTQPFLTRDNLGVIKATAALIQLFIQHRVFLVGIHADQRLLQIQPEHAQLKGNEVRVQDDGVVLSLIGEMVQVFQRHQPAQPRRAAPPGNAVFQQRLHQVLAVTQDNAPARRRAHVRKAQLQIDQANPAALARQQVAQPAQYAGQHGQHRHRQPVQQPQNSKGKTGHHGFGVSAGATPAGVL